MDTMKRIIRVLVVAALILLVPLVAMRFSDDVDWGAADFAIVGVLLVGAGLVFELGVRRVGNPTHRAILGLGLVGAVLLAWVELAVGIFGTPFAGS